jgi:hypothetical protein
MWCVLRKVLFGLSRLIPTIPCIQEITRSYHAQLTVKMIVGAIKKELTENMTLIIKTICTLIRANFMGVNHSYSKI